MTSLEIAGGLLDQRTLSHTCPDVFLSSIPMLLPHPSVPHCANSWSKWTDVISLHYPICLSPEAATLGWTTGCYLSVCHSACICAKLFPLGLWFFIQCFFSYPEPWSALLVHLLPVQFGSLVNYSYYLRLLSPWYVLIFVETDKDEWAEHKSVTRWTHPPVFKQSDRRFS